MAIKIQNSTIIDDGRNIVNAGITTVTSVSIGNTQVISSARQLQNIASLDATTTATIESAIANAPNTFADLQVTGISTFTNGPVLIGSGTSTGTTNQRLQVTGNGYISGFLGIGRTNPTPGIILDVAGISRIGAVSSGKIVLGSGMDTGDFGLSIIPYSNRSELQAEQQGVSYRPLILNPIDGNVGIASTVPSEKLDVAGNVRARNFIGNVTGNINSTGVNTATTISGTTATYTNITNTNINTSGVTTTARLNVGTGGTIITTTTGGFVGINSTVPSSTLAVGGTITELFNGTYWNIVSQADVGYGASQIPLNQYLGQLAFLDDFSPSGLRRDGGGSDDLIINESGFVGIATTSAINVFQVGAGNTVIIVDTVGNLGIGTTNPTQKLQVVGNALISGITTSSRLTLTGANNTATDGGQIFLNGATANRIDFNRNGIAAPTFTTRSAGTKIVLYPDITGSVTDYAFGIEGFTLWYSIPANVSTYQHRWYAGITQLADLKGTGELTIGSTNLTGTSSQRLQVTGGGYFSGNVGIGTTIPRGRLHLPYNGSLGAETLRIGNEETTFTENIYSIFWGQANTTQTGIGPYPNARGFSGRQGLGIHINSNDEFTIKSSGWNNLFGVQGGSGLTYILGNLGIGFTNPTERLQVSGNTFITGITTSTTYNTGVIGAQTSGILTTTATTANQVLDSLPTATFQTARYQVSIACTGQLVTAGMSTIVTSVGAITAGAGYTEATYTNVALTGGSGNDARANIGIGLSFNAVGFTSATDLIVTTDVHGLPSGVGTIAVSFASSIPNTNFTGIAVTAGRIYYAVGVGTTTLQLFNNSNGTSQVTGIGTTVFTGVGNTMTKAGGVASVQIVSPGSGYSPGNTLSAILGTLGSGFSFVVSTAVRNYQSTDIMILQSVGSAATACDYIEYGTIANSEILGSFGADISGANARLLFTPTYRNNTIKIVRSGITV